MKISAQLVVLIVGLMGLVLIGTFGISLRETRAYLQSQLSSHAQDTATSLGLSLSLPLGSDDEAMIASMLDAVFDHGDYQHIRLDDAGGETVTQRSQPLNIESVPEWFVRTIALEAPERHALVMSGWRQAGTVHVRAHPGYAYRQLWQSSVHMFWWFLACAVAGCLVGVTALRVLLRPLKQVQWQAESICNREFPVVEAVPATPELRRIVDAMNRLSRKVRNILLEQKTLADRLRAESYQDHVTGIGNKRYFESHLADRLSGHDTSAYGALCLVELADFKEFNESYGYAAADQLLREAAGKLSEAAASLPRHVIARLSGASFALFAEDVPASEAEDLAKGLSDALSRLREDGAVSRLSVGHVGVACFEGRASTADLLSEADMALRAAQGRGANGWQVRVMSAQRVGEVRSASEWRKVLEEAIASRTLCLHFQPAVTCADGRPMHQEVFVRLPDPYNEGPLLTAGAFMPMAERLDLAPAIDRQVITMVLERIARGDDPHSRYAVNVAPQSIENQDFIDWLEAALAAALPAARRIVFELPEYAAVPRLERLRSIVDRLAILGAGFALDHFGRGFGSFAYLQSLKLAYIKLAGCYQRGLKDSKENRFFVQSLADIAHGLDMKIIAESVESEDVWNALPALHIDAGQGYYIAPPSDEPLVDDHGGQRTEDRKQTTVRRLG